MGKSSNADRYGKAGKAIAKSPSIRSSARKLNLVAASIRGKKVAYALTQLAFEKRRIAGEVRKVLQAAIANAENNHSMDVDRLFVAEAWVGRSLVMKRMHTRGRGRSAGIEKPFSNLTIVVGERDEVSATAVKSKSGSKKSGGNMKKSSKSGAAESAAATGA